MNLNFVKMQALGNDFIIIENNILNSSQIVHLCNRKTGIGCDQLILISKVDGASIDIAIYNQDGSSAELCGNAFRALALYYNNKSNITDLKIIINDKIINTSFKDNQNISFYINEYRVEEASLSSFTEHNLEKYFDKSIFVDIGNPHLVLFTKDNNKSFNMEEVGNYIENHPSFPNKTNVEFATVIKNEISINIWERGVGITQACGTGAVASAIAAKFIHRIDSDSINVNMPGGSLLIGFRDDKVSATGKADFVFTGTIKI